MFRRKRVMVYGVYEVVTSGPLESTQTYAVNATGFDHAALQVLQATGSSVRAIAAVRFVRGIE
jgi:hypothetical protein